VLICAHVFVCDLWTAALMLGKIDLERSAMEEKKILSPSVFVLLLLFLFHFHLLYKMRQEKNRKKGKGKEH